MEGEVEGELFFTDQAWSSSSVFCHSFEDGLDTPVDPFVERLIVERFGNSSLPKIRLCMEELLESCWI
jgi:hypothetical protein